MSRILLILCACVALACFAPVAHIVTAAAAQTTVMPAISPVLPTTPQGPQPPNVWPMLGLSALIAAGGLALMRKIANTLS